MINAPTSYEEYVSLASSVVRHSIFRAPLLWGLGNEVWTRDGREGGRLASVRYPAVNGPHENVHSLAIFMKVLGISSNDDVVNVPVSSDQIMELVSMFKYAPLGIRCPNIDLVRYLGTHGVFDAHLTFTAIFNDVPPVGVADATLKLYGLSLRYFKPGMLNVLGLTDELPNVIWVGGVPHDSDEVSSKILSTSFAGTPWSPDSGSRLPRYMDRINPGPLGVRIMDPSSVPLGAYLGRGTSVQRGGLINFNAGTDGHAEVRGYINCRARVGVGTSVGEGAVVKEGVIVGRNCLLGANSVLGLSVGDAVILGDGIALMPSQRIHQTGQHHEYVESAISLTIEAVTFFMDEDGRLKMEKLEENRKRLENL